jgi:hypothetical protein
MSELREVPPLLEAEPQAKKPKIDSLTESSSQKEISKDEKIKSSRGLKMKKLPERACAKGLSFVNNCLEKTQIQIFFVLAHLPILVIYFFGIEGDPLPPGHISYSVSHGMNLSSFESIFRLSELSSIVPIISRFC